MKVSRSKLGILVLIVEVAANSPVMASNLVMNGDFASGSTAGWTQVGDWSTSYNGIVSSSAFDEIAPTGPHPFTYALELGNFSPDFAGVQQTINTTAGQSYSVSLYFAEDGNNNTVAQNLTVLWDGTAITQVSNDTGQNWEVLSASAVGTGSDTLTIEGYSNNGYNLVGDIQVSGVSPVPLPAAAWLMLSGLGGLGVFARKNRAA